MSNEYEGMIDKVQNSGHNMSLKVNLLHLHLDVYGKVVPGLN
jgi:hypothetical protein